MEIKIDFTKSAQENAEEYYAKAKREARRVEGAKKALLELQKMLDEEGRKSEVKSKPRVKTLRKREWYERFHWFYTKEGMLAIGGRDAHQNEKLNADYFGDADLFFHADIFGASVVILKDGTKSGNDSRIEVAQFAASYSSAWENMQKSVDVYCMRREQVSKATSKGSLGTGSFLLSGEREWYRNTQLGLVAYIEKGVMHVAPALAANRLAAKEYAIISQGQKKKSDAAKELAKRLGYDDLDYIMQQLPAGSFSIDFK
ncbi:MAG: NFACT RNA binding domain-containing protein [Candidatus Marsarchaeota archaeon]|nr:NFACT RNA binding domain-containing protein [Candidatus Marsarchaeota archaeon]